MRASTWLVVLPVLGASSIACVSTTSTLLPNPTDGGDAAIGPSSPDGAADAYLAIEAANADVAASAAGDGGGGNVVEAGPTVSSPPPSMVLIRFANWAPDAPPIDVCIAPHGTGAFQGPVVAELAALYAGDAGAEGDAAIPGLTSPLVSSYILAAPGQYDARIVVAGAGSCAAGIGSDATELPVVAAGGAETIAVLEGASSAPAGYDLRIAAFLDDVSASGATAIRVINAASGMPQIDVGTGTFAANNFKAIFKHVPIGVTGQASGAAVTSLVDRNGYYANAPLSDVVLSAHASGATADGVTSLSPTTIGAGSIVTIAVVGGASGAATALVECFDNAGAFDAFSDCIVSM
jgi:hypothetical protein